MRIPKFRVVNINDAAPKFRFGKMFLPVAEVLAIKRRELRRHPGFGGGPVCNVGNRHFVDWNADQTSFQRDRLTSPCNLLTLGVAAKTQRQDGHAKGIIWIEPV